MMVLSSSAKAAAKRLAAKHKMVRPVWNGPGGEGLNGGITFSMLSRYLTCKERFRVRVVEGLRGADAFNHRLEYGNMWHACEEAFAKERRHFGEEVGTTAWEDDLGRYAQQLAIRYPMARADIDRWYNVCRIQFPVYRSFWAEHPDVKDRTPLLAEQVFDLPYKLPSGRTVRLRGKWDSVDLVGKGKTAGIWLQENKTKGDIDEQAIKRQMTMDCQTMLYLVALRAEQELAWKNAPADMNKYAWTAPISGVRYNVVRRPLSGGKGTIVQKKGSKNVRPETADEYWTRLAQYIKDEPHTYFFRWNVVVSQADIERFRRECLDPILENVCDDWEWWEWCCDMRHAGVKPNPFDGLLRQKEFPDHCPRHFRMPFGCDNSVTEYGWQAEDAYLESGSMIGLQRVSDLFPELNNE